MSKFIIMPNGARVLRKRFYKVCKKAWAKRARAGLEESAVVVSNDGRIIAGAEVFA